MAIATTIVMCFDVAAAIAERGSPVFVFWIGKLYGKIKIDCIAAGSSFDFLGVAPPTRLPFKCIIFLSWFAQNTHD
jgi:hypothetical protein